ncbi:hypothetical protein CAter10_2168 [Collimonas arenae]|nr:hypothetical protein CAter10_2168 [Collimonas arenae]
MNTRLVTPEVPGLEQLRFANTFAQLPAAFYTKLMPTPLPTLIWWTPAPRPQA